MLYSVVQFSITTHGWSGQPVLQRTQCFPFCVGMGPNTYKVMWYYECKVTGEETKEWWNGKTTAGMTFFISHINKNKLSAPFQSKILPTHLKPLTFINTRKPRILSET